MVQDNELIHTIRTVDVDGSGDYFPTGTKWPNKLKMYANVSINSTDVYAAVRCQESNAASDSRL